MRDLTSKNLTIWFKNGTTATFHQVKYDTLSSGDFGSDGRVLAFYYYGQTVQTQRHAEFNEADIAGYAFDVEDSEDHKQLGALSSQVAVLSATVAALAGTTTPAKTDTTTKDEKLQNIPEQKQPEHVDSKPEQKFSEDPAPVDEEPKN